MLMEVTATGHFLTSVGFPVTRRCTDIGYKNKSCVQWSHLAQAFNDWRPGIASIGFAPSPVNTDGEASNPGPGSPSDPDASSLLASNVHGADIAPAPPTGTTLLIHECLLGHSHWQGY